MNINELNRIQTINIDKELESVEAGSGTFKEILDKVYDNSIIPIVNNSGEIIGISNSMPVTNIIEDNIEMSKFEKRYRGKDVMKYVLKSLELKARNARIEEVVENEDKIIVFLCGGDEVVIEEKIRPETYYGGHDEELPEDLDIEPDELGYTEEEIREEDLDILERKIKDYLRREYGHYLSGKDPSPRIEVADDGYIEVYDIKWGRKI